MKKFLGFVLTLLCSAALVRADELTFSFVGEFGGAVLASPSGLTAGAAAITTVTDLNTGKSLTIPGSIIVNAGPASSFLVAGGFLNASFSAGSPASTVIRDPKGAYLLKATMLEGSTLEAALTEDGSFSGDFSVILLSPTISKDFGLHAVLPDGSVAMTFGEDHFSGGALGALIGGGSLTIETTNVGELASMFLFGTGLVIMGCFLRLPRTSS